MHHPTVRIIHTTAFDTPVVEHWLEQEIAQWAHHEGSIRRPIAPRANSLTTELHLAPAVSEYEYHTYKAYLPLISEDRCQISGCYYTVQC